MGGYEEEIDLAAEFRLAHAWDTNFSKFFTNIANSSLMHSERWSLIFDYMKRNYPNTDSRIITGLVYLSEK